MMLTNNTNSITASSVATKVNHTGIGSKYAIPVELRGAAPSAEDFAAVGIGIDINDKARDFAIGGIGVEIYDNDNNKGMRSPPSAAPPEVPQAGEYASLLAAKESTAADNSPMRTLREFAGEEEIQGPKWKHVSDSFRVKRRSLSIPFDSFRVNKIQF